MQRISIMDPVNGYASEVTYQYIGESDLKLYIVGPG